MRKEWMRLRCLHLAAACTAVVAATLWGPPRRLRIHHVDPGFTGFTGFTGSNVTFADPNAG
jgi:hypothetical protein